MLPALRTTKKLTGALLGEELRDDTGVGTAYEESCGGLSERKLAVERSLVGIDVALEAENTVDDVVHTHKLPHSGWGGMKGREGADYLASSYSSCQAVWMASRMPSLDFAGSPMKPDSSVTYLCRSVKRTV